jgi:ankyrin repeat protein
MLLNHGVKSNVKNHRGETALHVVSRGRHDSKDSVRIARLFLEHRADVNAEDKDYYSPLHSASYNGNLEIARVLLHHGAHANAKNYRGETPLHQVSQGEYESQSDGVGITKLLLDRGVDMSSRDENGTTSLHLAAWHGKLEIARLLLEHSNSKSNRVRTLFHVGVEGEYYLRERNLVFHSHLP